MQVYHSGHPAFLRYPFLIPPHPGLLINFVLSYFWFSLHSLTRCRQVSWSSLRSLRKGSLLIAMALSSFKVRTCRSHLLKWGGKHTCFMTSLSYYYWVRFHTPLSGASCSLRLDCAILFVVNNTICKQNSLRQGNREAPAHCCHSLCSAGRREQRVAEPWRALQRAGGTWEGLQGAGGTAWSRIWPWHCDVGLE